MHRRPVRRMFPNAHAACPLRVSVADMGREGRDRSPAGPAAPAARGLAGLLLALVLAAAGAGCSRVVAGTPTAAPPHAFPVTAAPPSTVAAAVPGAADAPPATVAPPPAGPGAAAAALEPDVVANECLLDAAQLTALLGRPVRAPEQSVVRRDDGSRSSSCYTASAQGAGPAAAINVYRIRSGTPAAYVRAAAAGGRALAGAGEAAAVLDTAAGPTLQVAGRRYVVTVAVEGAEPDDAAWRTAARAALARLAAQLAAR